MALVRITLALLIRSWVRHAIVTIAIVGTMVTTQAGGQQSDHLMHPPDNPLAAPFVNQLREWLERDGHNVFKEFDWIETPARGEITKYRLYIPPNAREGHRLPLLVWLHGYCEGGTDNSKHLVYLNELFFRDFQHPPEMFILAVQTPTGYWPVQESPQQDDPLSVVDDIINDVLIHHATDSERILLSGVSSGGDACWYFACRKPDRFAAICPLATHGGDITQASKLINMGVWCFHSSNDVMPKPEKARAMVDAIQTAGGRAKFTETATNEAFPHNCWHSAFRDYQAAEWLLDQRRHKTTSIERSVIAARRSANLVSRTAQEPIAGRPLWWWSALAALVVTVALRIKIRTSNSQTITLQGN